MPKSAKTDGLPTSSEELICYTIYSAGHAFTRAYGPLLKKLNLTYPQYITLTVLWEDDGLSIGDLCKRLRLEPSTLTPLVKRLESLGHVKRKRGTEDERQVYVWLTQSGAGLKMHSKGITKCIIDATGYDLETLEILVNAIATLRDNLVTSNAPA